MKTSIDLNLEDAQVEYEYEPPYQNETPGGTEFIPGLVIINSVKSKGIELITLIPKGNFRINARRDFRRKT